MILIHQRTLIFWWQYQFRASALYLQEIRICLIYQVICNKAIHLQFKFQDIVVVSISRVFVHFYCICGGATNVIIGRAGINICTCSSHHLIEAITDTQLRNEASSSSPFRTKSKVCSISPWCHMYEHTFITNNFRITSVIIIDSNRFCCRWEVLCYSSPFVFYQHIIRITSSKIPKISIRW